MSEKKKRHRNMKKSDLDGIMMCYMFCFVLFKIMFHIMLFSIIILILYICCGIHVTKVRNSIHIIVCAQINYDVKVKIVDVAQAASL